MSIPETISNATALAASSQPILTIAIPTFNRAETLAGLLRVLEPQVVEFPQVEVFVSDNCSPDDTALVVAEFATRFEAAGVAFRSQRHAENIGADANFVSLYKGARGRFFWMCSDDDYIIPGALARVIPHLDSEEDPDIVYATSYGFNVDPVAEFTEDPLQRRFHTITDPRLLARVVNVMFTFVSGIIVNRERLESLPHEDPAVFIGTNLVQLSWVLPLLLAHRRSIVLWQRVVAARIGHAHGYSLGQVFGEQLATLTNRLLPNRPDLAGQIFNPTICRWFPSMIVDARSRKNETLHLDTAHIHLRKVFGGNFRYWIFTWPVLRLPLPLAKLWQHAGAAVSKGIYAATVPGFRRKQT